MFPDANGLPDPATREVFVNGAANPVDLEIGPGGDLFYADLNGGTIRRIHCSTRTARPTPRATATPTSGTVPLTVNFDGRTLERPDGDALTYAWDLDGDGAFDDSTARHRVTYYARRDRHGPAARDRPGGLFATDSASGSPPATPPTRDIDTPTRRTSWRSATSIASPARRRRAGRRRSRRRR